MYRPIAPLIINTFIPNPIEAFREKFYIKKTKAGRGE